MKNRDAFRILNTWKKEYENKQQEVLQSDFSKDIRIGNGSFERHIDGSHLINNVLIGISPLTRSWFAGNQPVEEKDFVKIGITMFHEFRHHQQTINKQVKKEIIIGDLSKVGNAQYYKNNWHCLPHEIDAEQAGILTMWSKAETVLDHADNLMLEYVTNRAQRTYMVKAPEDGFRSKEQVTDAFEDAYRRSLNTKRDLSANFLRSDDELAQILTNHGFGIRTEYQLFYRQLCSAAGQEADRKIASLVSYLHPELQKLYPRLDFSELDPALTFGIPMPETRADLRSRISTQDHTSVFFEHGMEQEFADAVAQISTPEQEFADAVAQISSSEEMLHL